MTQERIHPDDARRELASLIFLEWTNIPREQAVRCSVEAADLLLAELARTAKPEAPKEDEHPTFPCESPAGNFPMEASFYDQNGLITGVLYGKALPDSLIDRMVQAEARVKELEDAIRFHQSSLVDGYEVDRQLWLKVK